jgi:hypothetical protein
MVGIVVTISPSFSLYRMVVLPAASSPTCINPALEARSNCLNSAPETEKLTHHEDTHFLLNQQPGQDFANGEPHPAICLCLAWEKGAWLELAW